LSSLFPSSLFHYLLPTFLIASLLIPAPPLDRKFLFIPSSIVFTRLHLFSLHFCVYSPRPWVFISTSGALCPCFCYVFPRFVVFRWSSPPLYADWETCPFFHIPLTPPLFMCFVAPCILCLCSPVPCFLLTPFFISPTCSRSCSASLLSVFWHVTQVRSATFLPIIPLFSTDFPFALCSSSSPPSVIHHPSLNFPFIFLFCRSFFNGPLSYFKFAGIVLCNPGPFFFFLIFLKHGPLKIETVFFPPLSIFSLSAWVLHLYLRHFYRFFIMSFFSLVVFPFAPLLLVFLAGPSCLSSVCAVHLNPLSPPQPFHIYQW